MKRLLLTLFLFLLAGCQSNDTQWPTSWSQFDNPPSKKARPFITVKFLDSIDLACKEFEKNYKLQKLFQKKYDQVALPLLDNNDLTDKEWEEKTGPSWEKLWPRNAKSLSTAVEVLRQAEYPDWNLYSRYHIDGVGDLWRARVRARVLKKGKSNRDDPNYKYTYRGTSEAAEVCEALGFTSIWK